MDYNEWPEEEGLSRMQLRKLLLHDLTHIYCEVEGRDMSPKFQDRLRKGFLIFQRAIEANKTNAQ